MKKEKEKIIKTAYKHHVGKYCEFFGILLDDDTEIVSSKIFNNNNFHTLKINKKIINRWMPPVPRVENPVVDPYQEDDWNEPMVKISPAEILWKLVIDIVEDENKIDKFNDTFYL